MKESKNNLLKLRKYIEYLNYVGKDFSKKVREIYYDKKKKKQSMAQQLPRKERSYLKKE